MAIFFNFSFKIISIILILLINIVNIILYFRENKDRFSLPLLKAIIKRKFKIIAISYSNNLYQKQLKLNKKSALEIGEVDEYYSYGPGDLDKEFIEKNKYILSKKRGNGYWLWKPYIINKTLIEKLDDDDYLIYTDACTLFMNSTYLLINFLKENKFSMWMDRLIHKESVYTKRDAFILLGADMPFYSQTNQYQATIQIYQKSSYTVKFVQEWLYYCQDRRIITDDNNTLGLNNYHDFRDNRHDQTVLSLLIKKYGEANSGFSNLNITELKKRKSIFKPNIICMYRRMPFKSYIDLKKKCKQLLELQKHGFS